MSSGRRVLTDPREPCGNGGCDNQFGDLIVAQHDAIVDPYGRSFEVQRLLGRGQFGQVFEVVEAGDQPRVFALKISKSQLQYRTLAQHEANMLTLLQRNADESERGLFSQLDSHFVFQNHLCIVMELLSLDLYNVLKTREYVGLPLTLVQQVAHDMLHMLALLERCNVVHGDIKPENIVLSDGFSRNVKMIDFGSARTLQQPCSFYVQSRYYRAPEVVLGIKHGTPIDMWSLGCVLFELFCGIPLFAGQTEVQLLCIIVELLGQFPMEVVNASPRKAELFTQDGKMKSEEQICREKGVAPARRYRCFTCDNVRDIVLRYEIGIGKTPEQRELQRGRREMFVDFLLRTLALSQEERIRPADALNHPFLTTDFSDK